MVGDDIFVVCEFLEEIKVLKEEVVWFKEVF